MRARVSLQSTVASVVMCIYRDACRVPGNQHACLRETLTENQAEETNKRLTTHVFTDGRRRRGNAIRILLVMGSRTTVHIIINVIIIIIITIIFFVEYTALTRIRSD